MMYIILGIVIFSWIMSGVMADNYALRKGYKEQQRLNAIDLDRYNFVVGMLNQEQQADLHRYYVETGVIEE